MELKVSSQKLGLSPFDSASDPEEKEISEGEDEDDDRNHKHRRRETHSQSLEGGSFVQVLTRPYRKRNKPFENGHSFGEGDPQSGQTWKNYNFVSERDFSSRFEKRSSNQTSLSRAPFGLNQRIRGNQMQSGEAGPIKGRRREPVTWGLHDSKNGLFDVASQMVRPGPVPSGLFTGRGLPNISNAQGTSWNAFGFVPGVPSGGLDALQPLGLQGTMNIGIPRQRCGDFEERGFCLRGDMCPMEHGVNRIVIEDVQSLSQFNLPVSLPSAQLPGTSSGQGALPVISASSGSLANSKAFHAKSSKRGMTEDGLGLNDSLLGGSMAGGSDVYDPDQPLWTHDNPESSAALLALNQLNADETESFFRMDPSSQQSVGSFEGFDAERPVRSAATAGSQSSSLWRKIGSSKNRLGLEDKINSIGTSSSYLERDIKSEEAPSTGLQDVSHQGKRINVDENGSKVKEVSLKPHDDSIRNVRKPSQKALRTLFVNGIPLKDNIREALLSHFQKFGEVIDIYIPTNSEWAFVQFSKREAAEAALKAPDAVIGNRFIKLWWANRDNIPDDGISGTNRVPVTHGLTVDSALSHPFIPDKGKENPDPASGKECNAHASVAQLPVYDHLKPMVANGPSALLVQQKKLESLELLKEELRKKQQMLDQKRNEFRHQLDKLEKQAAGSKDVTLSDHATKRLKAETPPHHTNAETSKSPPRANLITESSRSAEHSVTHTSISNPTGAVQEPLGVPFSVNRFKLDNRPTAFRIVSPLPAGLANVATLEEHFTTYGNLSLVELEKSEIQETNDASVTPDVLARVSFTTRHSAEKAFLHGKCWQGHNMQFMWLTPANSGKEGGISGNPSASSTIPSDANVKSIREAASAHSQKSTALGSGEPETLIRQSDALSVSQDKDSKSTSTSYSSVKQLS
ncbi:hypothetical protein Pfo_019691 [Paulownia fortunei]|nr:hypothetical protein Pfo_019691 [Paulownia fortunei]